MPRFKLGVKEMWGEVVHIIGSERENLAKRPQLKAAAIIRYRNAIRMIEGKRPSGRYEDDQLDAMIGRLQNEINGLSPDSLCRIPAAHNGD